MVKPAKTLNAISRIFCQSTQEVLESVTGKEVTYAKTIQKIPIVHLRPDIGCFVLFNGDYSGLMIMNLTAEAAMSIYRNQMLQMGLPEEELAIEYTADDVVDSIGEIMNQIIGTVRRRIEAQYDLVSSNTQPKAIALTTSIILSIDTPEFERDLCRKLAFKVDGHPFHIELSMEKTEFESIAGGDVHTPGKALEKSRDKKIDIEQYQAKTEARPEAAKKGMSNQDIDFDALMNAHK
jgi:CheY-specific phosphatase CheX